MRCSAAARTALLATAAAVAVLAGGCGSTSQTTNTAGIPPALLSEARPVGVGPRFQPPVAGAVLGRCRRTLGPRDGVHVEVFAANRVVIVPAGIGTLPPRVHSAGRISHAGCYGDLVTLEPTGLVLVRAGAPHTLAALFHSWGQPLSSSQIASFRAAPGTHVATFVDGQAWQGSPGTVPLARHSEIVVEVGPHVPPHPSYTFPRGT